MLLLYVALPILCVSAVPPRPGPGTAAMRVVYGIAAWQTLVLVLGIALGLGGRLTTGPYAFATGAVVALLAVPAWRNRPRVTGLRRRRWLRTRRGLAAAVLSLGVMVALGAQLAGDVSHGTRQGDGLWYHIPRILFWTQQGSFEPWLTPTWQQLGLPVGADVVLGVPVFLGLGWAGTAYVTALLTVGASACVYLAALDLGLSRWNSVMATLLFATFPAVGARVGAANSDIAAAFPVLAGYVALVRSRDASRALAAFLLLNAVGIACKPTVAPLAMIVAAAALWRHRARLVGQTNLLWPAAGVMAGVAVTASSYWPIYLAFHDLLGGPHGRALAATDASSALRAVAANATQWLLEPLAYVPEGWRGSLPAIIARLYRALGVESGPPLVKMADLSLWQPLPLPDFARTGLVALAALPWVAVGLSPSARRSALPLWLLGFVGVSGLTYVQPWGGRFGVVLLAGYALLWAASRRFSSRRGRWALVCVAGGNVLALLGVVVLMAWFDATRHAKPGGAYDFTTRAMREEIAHALDGRPLWVATQGSLDALIPGPEVAFPFRYFVCPADGDWARALERSGTEAPVLALVHGGRDQIRVGPDWPRPGSHACATVRVDEVRSALDRSGWRPWMANHLVDVWAFAPRSTRSRVP